MFGKEPDCGGAEPKPAAAAASHESRLFRCGCIIGGANGRLGIKRPGPSAMDNSFGVRLADLAIGGETKDCDEVGEWQLDEEDNMAGLEAIGTPVGEEEEDKWPFCELSS